jgi:hypothetical protein
MRWLPSQWLRWHRRRRLRDQELRRYDATMARLEGKVRIGRKLSRDEMNER